MLKVGAYFFLTVILASCASQEKCSDKDWRKLGESDGRRGYLKDEFNRHQGSCESPSVDTERAAYDAGYSEGIAQFCTSENGYKQRFMGNTYCGQCPKELEADFLRGYGLHKTRPQLIEEANRSKCQVWRGD
ncbi:MAG TPA: DUF2799 domain-containing protein [Bdellovibrionales bacterium]|nr:DUF2799 domain-containing protein [Bdellovibrionales bacterium]